MAKIVAPETLRLFAELLDQQAANARSERFRTDRLNTARIAREIADRVEAGQTKIQIMAGLGLNRNEHGGLWDLCPNEIRRSLERLRAQQAA